MRLILVIAGLFVACIVLGAISLLVGPGGVGLAEISSGLTATQATIIWQLRFPRVLMSLLVGVCLGVSGVLMQTFFRNPLAEPYITGVSAGGALGAVAALSIGLSGVLPTAIASIAGGGVITGALYLFTLRRSGNSTTSILLLGLALGTLCGALVWFLLLRQGPGGTDQALAWLLGRVSTVGYQEIFYLLPLTLIGVVLAIYYIPDLDALLLGEEKAASLGVNLRAARRGILAAAALLAAASVAFCGVIAFIGLIVPHIARAGTGALHRRLLPIAALGGGCLVLLFDIASRTIDPPREIPLTILTSLLGAPFFIFVLLRLRTVNV